MQVQEADFAAFLVDRLAQKIHSREEAQILEAIDSMLPAYPRPGVPARALYDRHEFHLEELLGGSDSVFVQTVYCALLKREPDAEGRAELLRVLCEQDASRVAVISQLRHSGEGEIHGVHVSGLRFAYLLVRAKRIPVVGAAVAMLVNLGLLPDVEAHTASIQRLARQASTGARAVSERFAAHVSPVASATNTWLGSTADAALSLSQVLCLGNRELVELGYRRCAGRAPTDEERAHAMQQLETGALSPLLLIGKLCERHSISPADLRIAGFPAALSRERLRGVPVLGQLTRLGRCLYLLLHLDTVLEAQRREALRRLEACESELIEHYNMSLIELKRQVIEQSRGAVNSPAGGDDQP
jgi:hypothetical protein